MNIVDITETARCSTTIHELLPELNFSVTTTLAYRSMFDGLSRFVIKMKFFKSAENLSKETKCTGRPSSSLKYDKIIIIPERFF